MGTSTCSFRLRGARRVEQRDKSGLSRRARARGSGHTEGRCERVQRPHRERLGEHSHARRLRSVHCNRRYGRPSTELGEPLLWAAQHNARVEQRKEVDERFDCARALAQAQSRRPRLLRVHRERVFAAAAIAADTTAAAAALELESDHREAAIAVIESAQQRCKITS